MNPQSPDAARPHDPAAAPQEAALANVAAGPMADARAVPP